MLLCRVCCLLALGLLVTAWGCLVVDWWALIVLLLPGVLVGVLLAYC